MERFGSRAMKAWFFYLGDYGSPQWMLAPGLNPKAA